MEKALDFKTICQEFYLTDQFKPILPSECHRRHFRLKTFNSSWRKVPVKVRSKEELLKWIIKLGGIDVYYSSSKWMNPDKISAKGISGSYFVADNLLLGNDLVFDIDADRPVTKKKLEIARDCTKEIYTAMKKHSEYKLSYIEFTGSKGFRLVYSSREIEIPKNFRYRLDFLENKRKLFIDQLLKELKEKRNDSTILRFQNFLDVKTTTNMMGVVRVLGTINSKTGFLSTKIPASYLNKPIKEILDHVPFIGKRRPGIPSREMTERNIIPSPRLITMNKDVSGLASLFTPTTNYYITNKVLGIKRGFVPFFKYPNNKKNIKEELLILQEEYKLGNIYIFRIENKIIAISLKAMQKRQLKKVLGKSTSITKYEFIRHNRIFVPFQIGFRELLKGKYTGHLSRGHYNFVHINPNPSLCLCGWNKIELIKANSYG